MISLAVWDYLRDFKFSIVTYLYLPLQEIRLAEFL